MPLTSLEEMIRNALKGNIVEISEEKAYNMFYEIQRKLKDYKHKQENTKSEENSENCIVI